MNNNYNVAPNQNPNTNYQNQQAYQGNNQGNYGDQQGYQGNNQGQYGNQQDYQGNVNQGYDYQQTQQQNAGYNPNTVSQAHLGFDPTGMMNKTLSENTRLPFIRKVYCILMTQLCITAIGVVISVQAKGFQDFFSRNLAIYVIAVVAYIMSVIMLGCFKSISHKVPLNYSLLLVLTLSMTYIV